MKNTDGSGEAHKLARQRMFDRIDDRDLCWRRFERAQISHERWLHLRSGVIKEGPDPYPQLMVRNPDVAGGWSPQIKVIG